MKFTDKLNLLMKEKNINQHQLSQQVGIPYSTISNWYKSEENSRNAKLGALKKIAGYFHVSLDYLIDDNIEDRQIGHYGFLSNASTATIPVFRDIHLDKLLGADGNIIGFEKTDILNPKEYFYLESQDDSMIGSGILKGSLVLVRKQNIAENNQIMLCVVDNKVLGFKRYEHKDCLIILKSANSAFEPIIISQKDANNGYVKFLGVAERVLTDL